MLSQVMRTFSNKIKIPFSLKLPNLSEIKFGSPDDEPQFQLVVNNSKGLRALKSGNELKIAESYMNQDIDLNGKIDMLSLLEIKSLLFNKHPFITAYLKITSFLGNQITANKKNITRHYDLDPEFYLTFLDKTRLYSHGIFINDDEPLEQGSTRKLEFAMDSCHLKPGSTVLDLGAGWGSATEFLGKKGVHVDAITISKESANFISNLISKEKALSNCRVFEKDFLEYQPTDHNAYDAIISLGSMEHLPDYKKVLIKCYNLLKPGGYAYFDASSKLHSKMINSHFITRHIFPGNHKCLDLYHFLDEVKKTNFELISVHDDRHNYYLSLKNWAENFEKNKTKIIKKWGETIYRKFQLYLWGCCHSMMVNDLQAHRIVLRKIV